jgi:predicted ArsR family transcriptional regulator
MAAGHASTATGGDTAVVSLVGLLGDARAALVDHLHLAGPATVAELAAHLGVSAVATRRHLAVLAEEGLVEECAPRATGGRPATCFTLTDRALRLFPSSYDRFAHEALTYLTATEGRSGLLRFLRWRLDREADSLAAAVGDGPLPERMDRLATALSAAGFAAEVEDQRPVLRLVQRHCAIEDVAREHPEICAHEAAAFARVLGTDVRLSRRETIAGGAQACVCTVVPLRTGDAARPALDPDGHAGPDPAA